MHMAVHKGSLELVDLLIERGLAVTAADRVKFDRPLLDTAASFQPALVRPLLERGADPHGGRPIIGALNLADEDQALDVVRALVEAGVDVNRVYDWFGSMDPGVTALEFAAGKPKVAAYLRSVGAVDRAPPAPAAPAKQGGKRKPVKPTPAAEVIAFFTKHFGPVDRQSLAEIVPTTDPPIRIHVVRPNPKAECVTLFTTGLSTRPMNVPPGAEDYRFAELFLQLPADWPLDLPALSRKKHGWPVTWLRELAGTPHAADTWLGPGVGTVGNGDPPKPIGPGLRFTVALLLAEHKFARSDGAAVQLYRATPITTAEWNLHQREGVAALGDKLDAAGVGMVIDPARKSVV